MVLNYQRWTPPCGCSFQQETDSDKSEQDPVLLFAYDICNTHVPIAENQKSKSKLKDADFKKMREDYLDKITVSLNNNKTKNLSDFDNHPNNVAKLKTINELKKELKTQQQALKIEAQHNADRQSIEKQLDSHENNVLTNVITAFGTDYCLNCQDVYDKILTENQQTEV